MSSSHGQATKHNNEQSTATPTPQRSTQPPTKSHQPDQATRRMGTATGKQLQRHSKMRKRDREVRSTGRCRSNIEKGIERELLKVWGCLGFGVYMDQGCHSTCKVRSCPDCRTRMISVSLRSSSAIPPRSHKSNLQCGIGIGTATQEHKIVRSHEIARNRNNHGCWYWTYNEGFIISPIIHLLET